MKRFKIFVLYLTSFLVSVSPLVTYLAIHKDRYFCTKYDAIKLFSGGVIILFMIILKTLKKLKIPSGVFLFGLICVLSYLLTPIIRDLTTLSFLALVGEIGDVIIQAFISREKRRLIANETAKELKQIL